jgi:hypothetical protein
MRKRALNILKQFKEGLTIWIKMHIIEIRCFGSYAREQESKKAIELVSVPSNMIPPQIIAVCLSKS